ncbi:MAG: hypothetical protein GXO43_05850 [Crenarchaeota archaeon]|nr:hypothetical protein [Thermoproteota archaeon]
MTGVTYADDFIVDTSEYNTSRVKSKSRTPIDYIRLSPPIANNIVVQPYIVYNEVYNELKRHGFPPIMVWRQIDK